MPPDTLYTRSGELLEAAAALLPGIQRAYVAPAVPAFDCADQLTVHVPNIGHQSLTLGALPDYAAGLGQNGTINTCTFVVTIVRCVPGGPVPNPLDYEAASERLLSDAWLLWRGIPAAIRSGTLWHGCEQVILGPAIPVAESGLMAAWQLPVQGEVMSG